MYLVLCTKYLVLCTMCPVLAVWSGSLDQKCTADVVASEDVEAFVFNRELFKFLIENNEPFRKTIEEIAIERRADTAKKR